MVSPSVSELKSSCQKGKWLLCALFCSVQPCIWQNKLGVLWFSLFVWEKSFAKQLLLYSWLGCLGPVWLGDTKAAVAQAEVRISSCTLPPELVRGQAERDKRELKCRRTEKWLFAFLQLHVLWHSLLPGKGRLAWYLHREVSDKLKCLLISFLLFMPIYLT